MTSRKRPPGLCRVCGGRSSQHRITCSENRCRCGAPATIGSQCSICWGKSKRAREAAAKEAQFKRRAEVIAAKLKELDHQEP